MENAEATNTSMTQKYAPPSSNRPPYVHDPDPFDALETFSSNAEQHTECLTLLHEFRSLNSFQQNAFLSSLVKSLSFKQIHLLLLKLSNLMTVNFIGNSPKEIALLIFSYLDAQTLFEAQLVCKQWHALINDCDFVWKSLFRKIKTEMCCCEKQIPAFGNGDTQPFKAALHRHLSIQRNWRTGNYKQINVVCQDVGVITVIQFDATLIMMGTDDGHVLAANPKNGLVFHSFAGHSGGVWALQYVDNLLVTGSTDRTIRVWNIKTKALIHTLIGHRSTVRCLAVTEDGAFIISGSRDKTVRIWDAATGDCLRVFEEHHTDSVRCLSLQGAVAVTGSYDGSLRVWDVRQRVCLHHLVGHTDKIYAVALKDKTIVSGGHLGQVFVWDAVTGACIRSLRGHLNLISNVVISPTYIATGSTDCSVRHWDRETGALLRKFSLHTGSVSALTADESRMLTGSDSSLKLWSLDKSEPKELLPDVNVIWRVDMNESSCIATGDSVVEINGNRVNSSTLHIFHFYDE